MTHPKSAGSKSCCVLEGKEQKEFREALDRSWISKWGFLTLEDSQSPSVSLQHMQTLTFMAGLLPLPHIPRAAESEGVFSISFDPAILLLESIPTKIKAQTRKYIQGCSLQHLLSAAVLTSTLWHFVLISIIAWIPPWLFFSHHLPS